MPRANPISDREIEIVRRFKQARVQLAAPRSYVASRLGVDSHAIARIELGRAPLKCGHATGFCNLFGISPRWLATGGGQMQGAYPIPASETLGLEAGRLFSDIYDTKLRALFETTPPAEPLDAKDRFNASARGRHNSILHLRGVIERLLREAPHNKVARLRSIIADAVKEICAANADSWEEEIRRRVEFDVLRQSEEEIIVDYSQQLADNPLVSLTWKELKRRLKSVTGERGKKSAAADFAGVDRSNMNRWLDDDQEPGAEAAFRLLEWVTAEEANQKSSQGASTPGEPTAQTARKRSNETKQSEPGKSSHGQSKKTTPRKR